MYFYVDEAGNFTQPQADSAFSLVCALIVPELYNDELLSRFKTLRDSWTGKTDQECKGSSLDASQSAAVISLLRDSDVVLEFMAVDMATHSPVTTQDFKARSAAGITANITPEHHPDLVAALTRDSVYLAELSDQLFLQFSLTVQLILKVVETAALYYVQRIPSELAAFRWVVDRKDKTLTQMEQLWAKLVLPYGESRYATEAFGTLPNADYSHFQRFMIDRSSPRWASHMAFMKRQYGLTQGVKVIDTKLLLTEHREFVDSKENLGVQLADIAATTLRRALNDRLEREGWQDIGRLTIRQTSSPYIQFGRPTTPVPDAISGHAKNVAQILMARAKPMTIDLDRYFPQERRTRLPVSTRSVQAKAGRNDPCPCGSGRKRKKCCSP